MIRLLILLALFIGLPEFAFAQDSSLPMPDVTDSSVIFLSYVFGVVNGVLHGTGSQIMGAMFAKFNSAVLVLGGLVVLYTTLMSILNTANEGKFMGQKMHSFFVPFRTALGILLIAPTATGYSWIQIFVIWVVLQGVSAANMVWSAAIDYLLNGGAVIVQNQDVSAGTTGSFMYTQAKGMMPSLTCLALTQRAIEETAYSSAGTITPPSESALESVFRGIAQNKNKTSLIDNFSVSFPNYDPTVDSQWTFLNGMCGKIDFEHYSSVQVVALNQMMTDLIDDVRSFASTCDAKCYDSNNSPVPCPSGTVIPNDGAVCRGGVGDCYPNGLVSQPPIINPADYNLRSTQNVPILSWCNNSDSSLALNWDRNMQESLNIAMMDYVGLTYYHGDTSFQDKYSDTTQTYAAGLTQAKNAGWFMAGAYYFKLLQSNENAQLSGSSGLSWGVDAFSGLNRARLDTRFNAASAALQANEDRFVTWLLPFLSDSSHATDNNKLLQTFIAPANVLDSTKGTYSSFGQLPPENTGHTAAVRLPDSGVSDNLNDSGFVESVFPSLWDMLSAFNTMTQAQSTNANPIVLMMVFGSGMASTAIIAWLLAAGVLSIAGFATSAIPSVTVSDVFTTIGVVLTPLLSAVLAPMFITGIMLQFYLPMVPFMIFSFGAVGWIVGVVEAMVAAPIVAFAIMNPEGSDIFGKADPGVMLLLNLFLRPSLMIFGLVTGIMVSYIGVWIINDGFSLVLPAINNVSNMNWANKLVGLIIGAVAMPVIYLLMVMQVINRSFTLIYLLPDRVTRWMAGGQQESLGSEWSGAEKDVKGGAEKSAGALGEGGKGSAGGAVDRYRQRRKDAKSKQDGSSTGIS